MDTSLEYNNVLAKGKVKAPVTYREVAVAIANHDETALKYIADNDPIQVYALLHQSDSPLEIGKNAKFIPNKERVEGELKLLLIKKDFDTLNDILSKFIVNTNTQNYTTNQQIMKSLEDIGALSFVGGKYIINARLS